MPTLTATKTDTKNRYRSRIASQNIMEGDEFIMRGEPNIFVETVKRNEDKGTVIVAFSNGTKRKFVWNAKASIVETTERNLFRRNSLRKQGYPNYFDAKYGF
jgi:hypothetical protein